MVYILYFLGDGGVTDWIGLIEGSVFGVEQKNCGIKLKKKQ